MQILFNLLVFVMGVLTGGLLHLDRKSIASLLPIQVTVALIAGAVALGKSFLDRYLATQSVFDNRYVYYGQMVVLRACRGEYVTLSADGRLEATAKDKSLAQPFRICFHSHPWVTPSHEKIPFDAQIVLVIAGSEKLVAAQEDIGDGDEAKPLIELGTTVGNWERLRPRAHASYVGDAEQLLFNIPVVLWRNESEVVWCNYKTSHHGLYGSRKAENAGGEWESFVFDIVDD